MDVLKYNPRSNGSNFHKSSIKKSPASISFERVESPKKSPNNSFDSNIKTVPSNHYLERRFKAYTRAFRQVNSVVKAFNRKASPFFDQAKEDLNSFLQKSPPTSQFSKFPNEIGKSSNEKMITQRSEIQRNKSPISPHIKKLLCSPNLNSNSTKLYQDFSEDSRSIERMSSLNSKSASRPKLRTQYSHKRSVTPEFRLNISKISNNSFEKLPSIHSSTSKRKPKRLLVNLGMNMLENQC
ncbi:unnamed protein product [Blepharisma stoltei]|uniref:Uncharacterized protein n=1 Tax=Blepharisma stoltei TaxID=1481888 RepID=A0AAU9IWB0_9CILI|nr:unnamed protein product [Blepharisma stoltei]